MRVLPDKEAQDFKLTQVNILWAWTSDPDYEMNRVILVDLGVDTKTGKDEYLVLEGYHCSCYGFEDTKWEGTVYFEEELKQLKNAAYADFVKSYFS